MRRYAIRVDGQTFNLDVRELDADRFEVGLDGRMLEVEILDEVEMPRAVISPEMAKAMRRHTKTEVVVQPPAQTQTGAVAPAPVRPGVPNTAAVAVARTLTAPMPGLVAAVEVTEGSRVKRGDVLLTLEAMKMLNPIRAPRDAVVRGVSVKQGQTVAHGDALMHFEA